MPRMRRAAMREKRGRHYFGTAPKASTRDGDDIAAHDISLQHWWLHSFAAAEAAVRRFGRSLHEERMSDASPFSKCDIGRLRELLPQWLHGPQLCRSLFQRSIRISSTRHIHFDTHDSRFHICLYNSYRLYM